MKDLVDHVDFTTEYDSADESAPLDLFSTSPTLSGLRARSLSQTCENNAPFFAYKKAGSTYQVIQGSCNSWTCRRCGVMVAKAHYGRIVHGAQELGLGEKLYFITITCRGAGLTEKDALAGYGKWTSKFIDACYSRFSRSKIKSEKVSCQKGVEAKKQTWAYVQVTEKQKRGHPHSHILTTFCPADLCSGKKVTFRVDNSGRKVYEEIEVLRSRFLGEQCVKSGLGEQYDISEVRSVRAAAVYVAKYMFKPTQFQTHYPKNWKRVRFSNSYPKLPELKTDAFVLLSRGDWNKLASIAAVVRTTEKDAYENAIYFLQGHDVLVKLFEEKSSDDVQH